MSAPRSSSVFSVQQALGAAPALAQLQARIQASSRCLDTVRPLLPAPLRTQVLAGPLEDGEWCLLVRSTAAAAKVRQLLPALLARLAESGAPAHAIRVKVQTTRQ